jgi:branched-chain amino acid transport system ATP-binding protein
MPLLDVCGLSAEYGSGAVALRSVDLEVPEAGRVAVIGPNGAGKTTLTRAIVGSLRVQRGRVSGGSIAFAGRDARRASSRRLIRAGVSHVPEGRGIFAELSVEDNLRLVLGTVPRRTRRSVPELLAIYPILLERRRMAAGLLSGGQQQMLAIARALATGPRLLVADELSLGLAPLVVRELVEGLRRRSVDDGLAVLMVEQSAALALGFASYTYILQRGRVAHQGPSDELSADHAAAQFLVGSARDVPRRGDRHG